MVSILLVAAVVAVVIALSGVALLSTSRGAAIADNSKSTGYALLSHAVGDLETFKKRLPVLIALFCGGLAFFGITLTLRARVPTQGSSTWIVSTLSGLLRSYVLWAMLTLVVVLLGYTRMPMLTARATAARTNLSYRSVLQWGLETRTTRDAIRLYGTEDHSEDELWAKLRRVTMDGHDPTDEQPVESDPTTDKQVDLRPPEQRALDSGVQGELPGPDVDTGSSAGSDPDRDLPTRLQDDVDAGPGQDRIAADLEDAARNAHRVATALEDTGDGFEAHRRRGLGDRSASSASSSSASDADGQSADHSPSTQATDTSEDDPSPIGLGTPDETDVNVIDSKQKAEELESKDITSMELWDVLKVAKLEVMTAFNRTEFIWRFVVPALLTVLGMFTIFQTPWLAPHLYLVVFGGAIAVGATWWYLTTVRRHRRIDSVRNIENPEPWRVCACLVKTIETEDGTGYVAWMAGHRYFDFDRDRFCRKVGDRWHQRLSEGSVSPAIQEKFSRNVKQMIPLLHHLEHSDQQDGRAGIIDDIRREIKESGEPEGIVPKDQLADRVVNAGGSLGHDPDLVAEEYEKLIRIGGIVESDVTVVDDQGNEQTVTMVHLREQSISDQMAEIRAAFATSIEPGRQTKHELPDVEFVEDRRVAGTPATGAVAD